MKNILTFLIIFSVTLSSLAQAGYTLEKVARPSTANTANLSMTAKPATCSPGFQVVGKKLVEHEGQKWYEYTCAREEVIVRQCNPDTQVHDIKDKISSLPSDGKSKKSKLQMAYKCFNYVAVP